MKMTSDDLRDAISYTAQRTGFSPSLIEKDYYCSLVLKILYEHNQLKNLLIFKGGTLLSKGFFNFFRLSEDLDFSISNNFCTNRNERKKIADIFKTMIPLVLKELNFKVVSPFRGYNESSHYNGIFGYDSVNGLPDTIKFDVALKGDLVHEPIGTNLKTLLMNPISNTAIFPNIFALALTKEEVYAEKFRAALTREPSAIRDFFDIEKILDSGFNIFEESFIELVKNKISFDSHANINLTLEKRKTLESQIITDLRPVLKLNEDFNLEKTWSSIHDLTKKL